MDTKKGSRIIGVDFDDVLLNCNEALRLFHNRAYGTCYEIEHITNFRLEPLWGCDRPEVERRIFEFYEGEDHTNAQPVFGAVEGVKALKNSDNTLVIVTARPSSMQNRTALWLGRHFPNMFSEIYFANHLGDGRHRSKSEICKELGVDIFIDDSLDNAHDLASIPIPVLLFDKPWNQAEISSPITRVHTWEEIVSVLV